MIDFDSALELMRKYGYSSTSVHPFIYKKGDTLGICYSYIDENYGILERVKFFDSLEVMEEFLKKITWVKTNGKANNVRMILDNYETVDPKVIFLRNEKIMVKGEMEDIEGFEARAAAQAKMDEVSKVILQAGNLLLVYDDLKTRQIDYYSSVIKLRNEVRQKYFDLQTMVDDYNGVKSNKEVKFLPDVSDTSGINLMMEVSAKDRYNQYKNSHPTMEEAKTFVKDVWDLNSNLESNINYYEKQAEENKIRNEERVVDAKLEYMKNLQAKGKTLFKEDLGKAFRQINADCKKNSVELSNNFIQEKIANATKKYSYYDELDFTKISDYLRESIQNTNYGDLAIKYAKKDPSKMVEEKPTVKLPLNEIASHLTLEYNEKLNESEQAVLTLYNSKYRKLFDLILAIKDFNKKSITEIIKILNDNKDFSKIKTECFDIIQKRLILPVNMEVKNKYFKNINFDSFEMFIKSIVTELRRMKAINNKMLLNSDINLYFHIENIDLISSKYFLSLTNDINGVISQINDSNDLIALTLLKQDVPVLYSPYTIDFGDLYNKDNMEIKVSGITIFELLVDVGDVLVNVDDNITKVVKYSSRPRTIGNVSVVDNVLMDGQNVFCKLALVNNLANKTEDDSFVEEVVEEPVVNTPQVSPAVTEPVVPVEPVAPVAPVAPVEPSVPVVPVEEVVVEPDIEVSPVVTEQSEINIEPIAQEEIVKPVEPVSSDQTIDNSSNFEEKKDEENKVAVPVELDNKDENIENKDIPVSSSLDDSKQNVGMLASMLENKVQTEDAKSTPTPVDNLMNGLQKQVADLSNKKEEPVKEVVEEVKEDKVVDDISFLNDIMGNMNEEKEEVKEESKEETVETSTEGNKDSDDMQFLKDLLG